jgi:hypothetical protein
MLMLQDAGARELHAQFTNHGGHVGMVLLFCKPRCLLPDVR